MWPLIALLFVALGARVTYYGVTEYRYFLLALAVWLLFLNAYFLFRNGEDIRVIPMSLCLISLTAAYGPQSAFSVSERSQKERLVNILKKNKAILHNRVTRLDTSSLKEIDRTEITDKIEYLVKHYEFESLQSIFSNDFEKVKDSINKAEMEYEDNDFYHDHELKNLEIKWCYRQLGLIDKNDIFDDVPSKYIYEFQKENQTLIKIKGYDLLLPDNGEVGSIYHYSFEKQNLEKYINIDGIGFLSVNDQKVKFDLKPFLTHLLCEADSLKKLKNGHKLLSTKTFLFPEETMTLEKSSRLYSILIVVTKIKF